jgi:hypothetical protein
VHRSLRPPSSEGPFGGSGKGKTEALPAASEAEEKKEGEEQKAQTVEQMETSKPAKPGKPGKPKGAKGYGRTQVLEAHATEEHYPRHCAGCGKDLSGVAGRIYTGFQEIDVAPTTPGLHVRVTDHRYSARQI